MSRIHTIKGLALASGIICLLAVPYCSSYASSAWFNLQWSQLMWMLDPSYYVVYLTYLRRFTIVATIGILGGVSGIIILVTRTSVENNLRSIGAVWIIFGIISLPALGGLFALIAGCLAFAEHSETGGIARTQPHPVWQPRRSPSSPYARRVVCRSCNAMGDSEDLFCAICGAPMNG